MTSYELLEFYEKILIKVEELEPYTLELTKLINTINVEKDALLNNILSNGVNSNSEIVGKNNEYRQKIINLMQKFAMEFDVLTNHQKLIQIKGEIENLIKNSDELSVGEGHNIIDILDKYSKVTTTIYEFVKTRSNSITVELLNEVSCTVTEYAKFVESYKSIKAFILKTENKIEEKEDEKLFEIHQYDQHINPEYYIVNLLAIKESYEIMCQIHNISISEHPLKIVKIESGSLDVKYLGLKAIIDSLSFFMKKAVELIFNKYTLEGKVLRHKKLLELLKEDAEVIETYRELGIDLIDEDIYKYHFQLTKSIGKMIGQTTRIKIDKKEFNLESNLKQKYLTEASKLLLEEAATDSTQEEVDKESIIEIADEVDGNEEI